MAQDCPGFHNFEFEGVLAMRGGHAVQRGCDMLRDGQELSVARFGIWQEGEDWTGPPIRQRMHGRIRAMQDDCPVR